MRLARFRSLLLVSNLTAAVALAAPGFVAPAPLTVGRNLETYIRVRLTQPAPENGLQITVSSDDPARLLLSRNPDEPGSKTIALKLTGAYVATPEFLVQALADRGSATYTVTAPGFGSIQGTVLLAPSAILITGPSKAAALKAVVGYPARIILSTAVLDQSGKAIAQQPLGGGSAIGLQVMNSDPAVGSIDASALKINAGEVSASVAFSPVGEGKTVVTAAVPPGFSPASESNAVTINVDLPGIALLGETFIGKDLELSGSVGLGAPAPLGGVDVTVTSSDPKALIISKSADLVGSGTITVHIPAGDVRAPYHLQALADSGTIQTTATAPHYRTRVAPIFLAPSGFMIVYGPYGPPDEAEVLRTVMVRDRRPFMMSLGDPKPVRIALWSVYLDAKTKRGADITAQRLRPGVSVTLELKNSNPAVARIAPSLTIAGPNPSVNCEFVPLSVGQTVISISPPPGFTEPSNATSVMATVTQ